MPRTRRDRGAGRLSAPRPMNERFRGARSPLWGEREPAFISAKLPPSKFRPHSGRCGAVGRGRRGQLNKDKTIAGLFGGGIISLLGGGGMIWLEHHFERELAGMDFTLPGWMLIVLGAVLLVVGFVYRINHRIAGR